MSCSHRGRRVYFGPVILCRSKITGPKKTELVVGVVENSRALEGYSIHESSSSHASDTDRVADLRDLTRSQDTFTGSQVILEGDRHVSIVGEPGSRNEW